uniref:MADF domain-containing protein n=1 Tax=Megaselia scalaris TaxID=36166 RepID=T1GZJ8_MEGSC
MSWRNIDNDEKYKLIEMVKERSILWDSRLDEFKGADTLKMNAWDEVAKEFNICSNKAQRSFRILREHYRKHLANNNEDSWPYFEMMDFLRPIIKLRKKYSYSSSFETKTGKNVESFDDEEIPSSTMIEIPVHAELSDNEHTSRNGAGDMSPKCNIFPENPPKLKFLSLISRTFEISLKTKFENIT